MTHPPEKKSPSAQFFDKEAAATKPISINIPSVGLPKGGGALKGIDEKFLVNAANGTSSLSIPLPISLSRGGFQPSLSLSYNSGSGNGVFGLGWTLGSTSIRRKTEHQIPRYRNENESDIFLISGAEDLVPVTGSKKLAEGGMLTVSEYRPRIEGMFARIEKIIRSDNSDLFYWKVTSKENVVTFFGMSSECRIADPTNDRRIFEWLPEVSFDDKGNCIRYIYKQEDTKNVIPVLHEQHRLNGSAAFTNNYLKRIQYGNKIPFYPEYVTNPQLVHALYEQPSAFPTEFMFELVFDYGEHAIYSDLETEDWKARIDAFSHYKSGFEIRTYRLCKRVLMFHQFSELNAGAKTLVRSLDFNYNLPQEPEQPAEVTYLAELVQHGYSKQQNGSYSSESLPVVRFDYQRLQWNTTIHEIAKSDLTHAPVGLTGNYQWIDLYNEGISGILSEQAEGWYYKTNLGNSHFSQAHLVSPKPSLLGLAQGDLQIMDLDANGKKQVVSHTPGLQGFFELTEENNWLPFTSFASMPSFDVKDPNIRLIDLNGDGKSDILITEENVFRWYPSKGVMGYDSSEVAEKPFDEEKGPAIVFRDASETIYIADMSGDGLSDIIRISNSGAVCYWPNLGHGFFGKKVNMGRLEIADPASFNFAYLQLADVSGTGTTDIIYLGNNKWQVWINRSGNSFSEPCEIDPFWSTTKPVQVNVLDLLGNGTGCIVWSSPLPAQVAAPMQYIDLMGGKKPHIMIRQHNGMGKITSIEYKSSTQYYLEDAKSGKPWMTKLPFPVHCVSKVETRDEVTDLQFTTKYSYHHGYFDHPEKEFRGFGRVDQLDTEDYEYLKNSGASNANTIAFHEPPMLTRTWFHTGAFLNNHKMLHQFEKEYWYQDAKFENDHVQEHRLSDTELPQGLTIQEQVQAARACKGMVLRTEVFALDKTAKEKIPFSVATHNCFIRMLQAKTENPYAVFLVHESEAITFSYEREITDPRVSQTLALEIDDFGNVLKAVAVVYGRNAVLTDDAINHLEIINAFTDPGKKQEHSEFIKKAQTKEHVVYTETKLTTDALESINGNNLTYYRLPLPWSVKTYEIYGSKKESGTFYQLKDFGEILTGNMTRLGYHETFDPLQTKLQLRLTEQVETLFLSYDLEHPLPAGKHGALGINYESYQLAYTPELVNQLFNIDQQGNAVTPKKVTDTELQLARYCHVDYDPLDMNWWIRSGKMHYFDKSRNETRNTVYARFYMPIHYSDPFGTVTRVEYPSNNYFLFVQKTIDALDNATAVVDFDYRVLAPRKMIDLNDNLSEVSFNALGMVVGAAVMGKGNQADDLSAFRSDLTQNEISDFFNDPFSHGKDLLANASSRMVYDLHTLPVKVASIARENHVRNDDGSLNPESNLQYSFEFTGGMGQSILKKVRAESGMAKKLVNGTIVEVNASPRWVGNGRTIFNNKSKPVKQYEPYFSTNHLYEDEPGLRELGVSSTLHYDSAGRMIREDYPDGSFTRIEYNSWQQKTFDQNDTIKESKWAALRGYSNDVTVTPSELLAFSSQLQSYGADLFKEQEALGKSLIHADTPSIVLTDSLGRPFYSIDHDAWQIENLAGPLVSFKEFSANRLVLDIEGNLREVIDGRDNRTMKYDYDMLGHTAYTNSMDAGERWLLNDSMGKPLWAWDNKDQKFETEYDLLHRPVFNRLMRNNQTFKFGEIEYGTDKAHNLNGASVAHYDTAGVNRTYEIDFKGAVRKSSRQLCSQSTELPDWNDLSAEVFISTGSTDALGRVTETVSPHTPVMLQSTYRPVYNEANLLEQVKLNIRNGAETTHVSNIDYNAKGQRTRINYGNGTFTKYEYDEETFRLRRMITCPDTASNQSNFHVDDELKKTAFQFLSYVYDPMGNITHIEDESQPTYYFSNTVIKPENKYRYDALYRLIEAKGREHIGQQLPSNAYDRHRMFFDNIPTSDNAFRNYTQRYQYDETGNMKEMQHIVKNISGSTGWTRSFDYAANSNQLISTTVGNHAEQYSYDVHGNMESLPHLPAITWNFKDQLNHIQIQASADNDHADGAFYLYDGSGQRIRKLVNKGTVVEERIYLDGFEIFRVHQNGAVQLERESLHIRDDHGRIALTETLTIENGLPLTTTTNLTRYQLTNFLGSVYLELDDAAQIVTYEEFHPFGATAYQNQNKNIKAAAKQYRYTGMERDEESGLEYHSARQYLPWLARWLSADPTGLKGGLNLYTYVENSPLQGSDPGGSATVPSQPNPEVQFEFEGATVEFKGIQRQNWIKAWLKGKMATMSEALSIDVDELLAVGDKNIGKAEAMRRAKDVNIRQFLDSITNRISKHLKKEVPIIKKTIDLPKGPVSVVDDPSALFNRKFGDVEELKELFKEARDKFAADKSLSAGKMKKNINAEFRRLIVEGTSESAKKIRNAFEEIGFDSSSLKPRLQGRALEYLGKAAAVFGSFVGGYQVGQGINQIAEGQGALGAVDIAEGGANLALSIGTPIALKSGALVAEAGAAAGILTLAAGVAAGVSVGLAAETTRAAIKGEETPVEVADKAYGTSFSDIYAWQKRSTTARVAFGILTLGASESWYHLNQYVENR